MTFGLLIFFISMLFYITLYGILSRIFVFKGIKNGWNTFFLVLFIFSISVSSILLTIFTIPEGGVISFWLYVICLYFYFKLIRLITSIIIWFKTKQCPNCKKYVKHIIISRKTISDTRKTESYYVEPTEFEVVEENDFWGMPHTKIKPTNGGWKTRQTGELIQEVKRKCPKCGHIDIKR